MTSPAGGTNRLRLRAELQLSDLIDIRGPGAIGRLGADNERRLAIDPELEIARVARAGDMDGVAAVDAVDADEPRVGRARWRASGYPEGSTVASAGGPRSTQNRTLSVVTSVAYWWSGPMSCTAWSGMPSGNRCSNRQLPDPSYSTISVEPPNGWARRSMVTAKARSALLAAIARSTSSPRSSGASWGPGAGGGDGTGGGDDEHWGLVAHE